MKKPISSFSEGFSLIELAIVLAILGVIGGLSLPLISQQLVQNKHAATLRHQDLIMRSLAAYVLRNDRLPAAANPAVEKEKLGEEDHNLSRGIVPFKELGLDADICKDGYNNYISYIVDSELCKMKTIQGNSGLKPLTSQDIAAPGYIPDDNKEAMRLESLENNDKPFCQVRPSPYEVETSYGVEKTRAVILIAHGPGGHGAFKVNGSSDQKVCEEAGPAEERNAAALKDFGQIVFANYPYSSNKNNLFRHTVRSITRDNLLAFYTSHPCINSHKP